MYELAILDVNTVGIFSKETEFIKVFIIYRLRRLFKVSILVHLDPLRFIQTKSCVAFPLIIIEKMYLFHHF